MDRRLTFDQVVDIYDRARPGYPAELVDALFGVLPAMPQVLEVGPGTGQLTAELLERGAKVTAVELGPQLATWLQTNLGDHDGLRVINAAFEDVAVEPDSFDAVVAATAYHWVADEAKAHRPAELLRPGGCLGVIDLIQVDSAVDGGYFDRVQPIYDRYGDTNRRWDPLTHETAMPPVADVLEASGLYERVDVLRHPWDQTYSSDQYRDLLYSYSGTQLMPEPDRTRMVDELVAVIDSEFNGTLTRPLAATLTLAQH